MKISPNSSKTISKMLHKQVTASQQRFHSVGEGPSLIRTAQLDNFIQDVKVQQEVG